MAHMAMAKPFAQIFKHDLDDFWLNNAQGLDRPKFIEELLDGSQKPLLLAVKQKYGKEAVAVMARLLPPPKGLASLPKKIAAKRAAT